MNFLIVESGQCVGSMRKGRCERDSAAATHITAAAVAAVTAVATIRGVAALGATSTVRIVITPVTSAPVAVKDGKLAVAPIAAKINCVIAASFTTIWIVDVYLRMQNPGGGGAIGKALTDVRSRAQDALLLNHELGIAGAGTAVVEHTVGAAKAFVGRDVALIEADQRRGQPNAG